METQTEPTQGALSRVEINMRIDALTAVAEIRKAQASDSFVSVVGGAGIAFLNSQECQELHDLKLQLPLYSTLRKEAQDRLAERVRSGQRGRRGALRA